MASESDQRRPSKSTSNFTCVLKSVKALLMLVFTITKSMASSIVLPSPNGRLNSGNGKSS